MQIKSGAVANSPQGLTVGLVALLATVVMINYIDRGNLATAAPLLASDLHLTNGQIGMLLSAFFWIYAPMQPLAGYLVERLDVHKVLAVGLLTWSIATIASGLASTFIALLLLRLLLGVGESVIYPSTAKFLAMRALEHQRGKANGIITAGQALGPSIGTLLGGLLLAHYGWRSVMIVFGAVSLLWLIPWLIATRGAPSTVVEAGNVDPPTYGMILRTRAAWGAVLGQFCCNYSFYFLLGWMPKYLVDSRGFSVIEMSQALGAVYIVQAIFAATTGFVSDRWILAGQTPTVARKTFMAVSCVGITICMLLAMESSATLAVGCLIASGFFLGLQAPMVHIIAQTLGGPRAAGQWMGVQNFGGNLAGIVAPIVTGFIIDSTGSYYWAFAVAGVVSLLSGALWTFVVPKIENVKWPEPRAAT
jgi:MFS family permease